jgi:hypothetical protein
MTEIKKDTKESHGVSVKKITLQTLIKMAVKHTKLLSK